MNLRHRDAQSLPEPVGPRRVRDATPVVVVVYALMVLAAPLAIRYWPEHAPLQVVAPVLAAAPAERSCARDAAPACAPAPATDDLD